jgi:hypothetical protein
MQTDRRTIKQEMIKIIFGVLWESKQLKIIQNPKSSIRKLLFFVA